MLALPCLVAAAATGGACSAAVRARLPAAQRSPAPHQFSSWQPPLRVRRTDRCRRAVHPPGKLHERALVLRVCARRPQGAGEGGGQDPGGLPHPDMHPVAGAVACCFPGRPLARSPASINRHAIQVARAHAQLAALVLGPTSDDLPHFAGALSLVADVGCRRAAAARLVAPRRPCQAAATTRRARASEAPTYTPPSPPRRTRARGAGEIVDEKRVARLDGRHCCEARAAALRRGATGPAAARRIVPLLDRGS